MNFADTESSARLRAELLAVKRGELTLLRYYGQEWPPLARAALTAIVKKAEEDHTTATAQVRRLILDIGFPLVEQPTTPGVFPTHVLVRQHPRVIKAAANLSDANERARAFRFDEESHQSDLEQREAELRRALVAA